MKSQVIKKSGMFNGKFFYFNLTFILVTTILLVGCGDIFKRKKQPKNLNFGSVTSRKYNSLVDKHNNLVNRYNKLLDRYAEDIKKNNADGAIVSDHIDAMNEMNEALKDFSENATTFLASPKDLKSTRDIEHFQKLKAQFEKGKKKTLKAQKSLKVLVNALYNQDVSEKDRQKLLNIISGIKSDINFDGILLEHETLWNVVEKAFGGLFFDYFLSQRTSENSVPEALIPAPEPFPTPAPHQSDTGRQIELNASEEVIAEILSGGGIIPDLNNNAITAYREPTELQSEALKMGFNRMVTEHALDMAKNMNGIAGFACTAREGSNLIPILNRIIGHMKGKANNNADDFEISLVLDYSQSMSNNIEGRCCTHIEGFV